MQNLPWELPQSISYPGLTADASADVVIIGGGLAGVVSAYMLARAGKDVILLEKDELGGGATHMTTAFITQAIDTGPDELIAMLGLENARLVWQSGESAIETIRTIAHQEEISCDFDDCPAYMYARTEKEYRHLAKDARALHALGFPVTQVHGAGLGFKSAGYLSLPGQAKFHPMKFLYGCAEKAAQNGVRIFEHTPVAILSDTGPVRLTTGQGHTVSAKDCIVATHLPFNNPKPLRFKKGMYRSYVLEARMPRGSVPEALYWDQSRPYTYFRVDRDGDADRLILGGADHRAELPMSASRSFHALERYATELFGAIPYAVTRTWRGPIIESSDGLPLIGSYAPHRYVATAFSGNGMTYAVVAGLLFRDILSGTGHPWERLYDPTRKFALYSLIRKGSDYMREFFGGAVKNALRR